MRIKVLSRDEKKYTRERPNDLQRVQRNAAPELHPFERAREYKRALNAVKLDRVFAKPFLGNSTYLSVSLIFLWAWLVDTCEISRAVLCAHLASCPLLWNSLF